MLDSAPDVIINCLPLNEASHNMVDAGFLEQWSACGNTGGNTASSNATATRSLIGFGSSTTSVAGAVAVDGTGASTHKQRYLVNVG